MSLTITRTDRRREGDDELPVFGFDVLHPAFGTL